MRRTFKLSSAAAAVALCGCVSISSLQTARPQAEGKMSGLFAVGYESLIFTRQSESSSEEEVKDVIEEIKIPILEAGLRYGLMRDVDMGFKYTIPGTMALDAKYLLWESGPMAVAAGAGFGYGSFDLGSSSKSSDDTTEDNPDDPAAEDSGSDDSGKTKYTIMDLFVPVYVSYDMSDWSAVYATPRILSRSTTIKDDVSTDSDSSLFVGTSLGVHLAWFVGEFSVFTCPGCQGEGGITQIMVGYWGGWDELQKPGGQRAARSEHESSGSRRSGSKKKKSSDD